MKINEVEQQVGITKKNIRFYEQQGLLCPKRNSENGYREYAEADVNELKKIRLLRKLSLPIEEIRKIQRGDLLLKDALQRQLIVLEREKVNLQETSGLCQSLMEDRCQYPDLRPDEYLERMVEMERRGTKFSNADKHDTMQKMLVPVIVAMVFTMLMIGLIAAFIWGWYHDPIPIWLLGFLILIPLVPAAAVIVVAVQRIKEIKGGEEDVARKY